jgi:hypothetical protein
MSQPIRHDRHRSALPEMRSRRDSSAAMSPYFIDDVTMTLSEWQSNRDREFVVVIAD